MGKQITITTSNSVEFNITEITQFGTDNRNVVYPKGETIISRTANYFTLRNLAMQPLLDFRYEEVISLNGVAPTSIESFYSSLKNFFFSK